MARFFNQIFPLQNFTELTEPQPQQVINQDGANLDSLSTEKHTGDLVDMKIGMKITSLSLTVISLSTILALGSIVCGDTLIAVSQTKEQECPYPNYDGYREPKKTKYVKIRELGIALKVPVDRRVVFFKDKSDKSKYLGGHFKVLNPPEYRDYQCRLAKGLEDKTQPYPIYYAVKNPQKLRIDSPSNLNKLLPDMELFKSPHPTIGINNIDFVPSFSIKKEPAGMLAAAFVPKTKPDLVVVFVTFDETVGYKEAVDFYLKKIENSR